MPEATVNNVRLHYRDAGRGAPLLLLHGLGSAGQIWDGVTPELARSRRVIAPDLRGIGSSERTAGGYDKKTMAADVHELVRKLGIDRVDVAATVYVSPQRPVEGDVTEVLVPLARGQDGFEQQELPRNVVAADPGHHVVHLIQRRVQLHFRRVRQDVFKVVRSDIRPDVVFNCLGLKGSYVAQVLRAGRMLAVRVPVV